MQLSLVRSLVLRASFLGLGGLVAIVSPLSSHATLPASVEGQPLPSLAPMLERVTPAVVNINSKTHVRVNNPLMNDPFFRHFFGLQNAPQERIAQSLGSGVVIDADKGYVLTNNHVVEGADDISVTLQDSRTLKAKVVGTDPDTDVAVIQIPAENLTALPLADSSKLRVGDFVVAVGNPFGLGQTVTSGIVSALGRTGLRGLGYQNFIQTDASINPGNSGGALVNLHGELVGINSAIYSPSGGNVGIGFAIPANLARQIMQQLVSTGTVKRGTLGVETQDLTPEIARTLEARTDKGAVVTRIQAGSPAEGAGLKPGDVILELNEKTIQTEQDLHNAEGLLPVGTPVTLKVWREGKLLSLTMSLVAPQLANASGGKLDPRLEGAELTDSNDRQRRSGITGASITRLAPGSRASSNGLKVGDVIVAVNQVNIDSVRDLTNILSRRPRQLLLSVVRGREMFFVMMQ